MPTELWGEGRVVGYSAYEIYVKQHLALNPTIRPATERQWLASSLASGSSLLLKVKTDATSAGKAVTANWYRDYTLPENDGVDYSLLCAANTIVGSFFDGTGGYADGSNFAHKVTSYGNLLKNASGAPATSGDTVNATNYPLLSTGDFTEDMQQALKNYMKVIDGIVIQPGTWKNTGTTPTRDITPNLSKSPTIRLHFRGPVDHDFELLLTGFSIRAVVAGESGFGGSVTEDTRFNKDGAFLGPGQYPWANKIVFSIPNAFEQYLRYNGYSRKLPSTSTAKTPKGQPIIDMETTDPKTYYESNFTDSPVSIDVTKLNVLPEEADVLTVYRRDTTVAPALYGVKTTGTGIQKINPIDSVAPGTVKIFSHDGSTDSENTAKSSADAVQRKVPNNLGFVQANTIDDFRVFQADTSQNDTTWIPISDDKTVNLSSQFMYQIYPIGYLGARNGQDMRAYDVGDVIYESDKRNLNVLSYITLYQKLFYIVPPSVKAAFGISVKDDIIKRMTEATRRSGVYHTHIVGYSDSTGYWHIQMIDDLRRQINADYHNLSPYETGISEEEKAIRLQIDADIDDEIDSKYYFLCIGSETLRSDKSGYFVFVPVDRETNILDMTAPIHINLSELPRNTPYTVKEGTYAGQTIYVRGFLFDTNAVNNTSKSTKFKKSYFAGTRAEGELTRYFKWMYTGWGDERDSNSPQYTNTFNQRHPYLYEVWNSTSLRHDYAVAPRLGKTISEIMNVYKTWKLTDVWSNSQLTTAGVYSEYRGLTLWDFIKQAVCHDVTNGSAKDRKSAMTSDSLAIMGTRYLYTKEHLQAFANNITVSTSGMLSETYIYADTTSNKPDIRLDFDIDPSNILGVNYIPETNMRTDIYQIEEKGGIYVTIGQSGKRYSKSISLVDTKTQDLPLTGMEGTIDISDRTLNWITLLNALGSNLSIDIIGDFLRKFRKALIDASSKSGQYILNIQNNSGDISIKLDPFSKVIKDDTNLGTYVTQTTVGSKVYKDISLRNTSNTDLNLRASPGEVVDYSSSSANDMLNDGYDESTGKYKVVNSSYISWKNLLKALRNNKVIDLLGYNLRIFKHYLTYKDSKFTIDRPVHVDGEIVAKTGTGNHVESGTNYMVFNTKDPATNTYTSIRLYITNTEPTDNDIPVGSIGIGWGE